MRLVHDARRALGARALSPRVVTLLLLAGALAFAGCGGGSDGGEVDRGAFDPQINLADCEDWNEASTEEKLATVEQIREFTGGPVQGTGGTGATLSDERAFDLFDATCSAEHARYFKLYKLYGRGAAFGGE